MNNICKEFGRNIKYIREKGGITQEELAEKSGLHRTYISSLERGKRSVSLKNIELLATSLNIEIYKLFIFENNIEKEQSNDKKK